MKYFTKEYYKYIDSLIEYYLPYEIIADKDYSNEEIEGLVAKNKESYINDLEEEYNTPPVYEEWEEEALDLEEVFIEDVELDPDEDNLRNPKSWEEYYKYKKSEYERDQKDFENRAPFDRKEAERDFEENFNMLSDREMYDLPDFVFDQVDIRFLALNLMPKFIYKKLEKENKNREKLRNKKAIETKKLLKKNSNYTACEILEAYLYEYNILTEIHKNSDGDYFFYLNDKERFLYFKDLVFIENEIEACHDELYIYNYEVYDLEDGKEYHFILFDDFDGEYKYLTIRASESGFALDEEQEKNFGIR